MPARRTENRCAKSKVPQRDSPHRGEGRRHAAGACDYVDRQSARLGVLQHSGERMERSKTKAGSEAFSQELNVFASFAENPDLHLRFLISLVDVNAQIVQLLDQFLQIFRLELGQVKG